MEQRNLVMVVVYIKSTVQRLTEAKTSSGWEEHSSSRIIPLAATEGAIKGTQ
jgi:hypothetical protein